MQTWQVAALLVLGVAMAVGSLVLRVRTSGRYELKTGDLVFLVIPLVLAAVATGKLRELTVGDLRIDLSTLWVDAAKTRIEAQVAKVPPATVEDVIRMSEVAEKGGVGELPRLLERKVDILAFRLGYGSYYGPAIRTYFERMFGSSYLRFIVVVRPDGTLLGVYAASALVAWLGVAGDRGYAELAHLFNSRSEAEWATLAKLPGFVPAEYAVRADTSKRDALGRMAQLDVDGLPVIDTQRRFVGTIERSKLTASLILAVTDKVEAAGRGAP